ncbi:hypothetical protein SDC9_184243 [bioreactor metagenome]|uniref:Uncharacterized protein n=1 Tax=bioreactor metagenome TaxID=1076179 RepID=A0A645HMQ5_9ZZZZ
MFADRVVGIHVEAVRDGRRVAGHVGAFGRLVDVLAAVFLGVLGFGQVREAQSDQLVSGGCSDFRVGRELIAFNKYGVRHKLAPFGMVYHAQLYLIARSLAVRVESVTRRQGFDLLGL